MNTILAPKTGVLVFHKGMLYNHTMDVISVIKDFDEFLSSKKASFSGVVIGGGALALMGITTRGTKDIDVLDPIISDSILELAKEFASQQSKNNMAELRDDWLNNGPRSLIDNLPEGWMERSQQIFSGKALMLSALGRADFLKSKLFAYCDRGQDFDDCIKMNPSREELLEALSWVKVQDQNPHWVNHVQQEFTKLAKELGYAL